VTAHQVAGPAAAPPGAPPLPAEAVEAPSPAARSSRLHRSAGTPAILRLLLIGLVAGSLGWGIIGAFAVSQHATAADQVVTSSEPLSLDAQQMYRSLSDADVTATTAFLTGPPEPLAVRRHYEADIAQAAADLAALRSAPAAAGGSAAKRLAASLADISASLPVNTGYVQQAQTYSSLGFPLTGAAAVMAAGCAWGLSRRLAEYR
jgi:hypothetical protein